MRFPAAAFVCVVAIGGAVLGGTVLEAQERPKPATTKYVRLTTPRILPIEAKDYTPEQKAAVGNTNANLNFRTALYEPELGKRWWSWLTFVWSPEGRGESSARTNRRATVPQCRRTTAARVAPHPCEYRAGCRTRIPGCRVPDASESRQCPMARRCPKLGLMLRDELDDARGVLLGAHQQIGQQRIGLVVAQGTAVHS